MLSAIHGAHPDFKAVPCQHGPDVGGKVTGEAESDRQEDPEAEKAVRNAIESAATLHLDLLNELQRTRAAAQAAKNNEITMTFLTEELKAQTKLAEEAALATDSLRKKRSKTRNSITQIQNRNKRLSVRCIEPVSESEQAYHQALAAQSRAEQRAKELQHDAEVLWKESARLAGETQRYKTAQQQLEQLYSNIFDGTTPGFPEEDRLEEQYKRQKRERIATEATLQEAKKAQSLLSSVKGVIDRIVYNNELGERELAGCRRVTGLGYFALQIEKLAILIDTAQIRTNEMANALTQPHHLEFAKEHDALIQHFTAVGGVVSSKDGAPYAMSSKDAAHGAVQLVKDEAESALETCERLSRILKGYECTARTAFQSTSRAEEESKNSLLRVREAIFEEVVGHGASPPPYRRDPHGPSIAAGGLAVHGDLVSQTVFDEVGPGSLPPTYTTIFGI